MNGIIILPKYLSGHWSPKVTNGKEDFSNISSVTQPIRVTLKNFLDGGKCTARLSHEFMLDIINKGETTL